MRAVLRWICITSPLPWGDHPARLSWGLSAGGCTQDTLRAGGPEGALPLRLACCPLALAEPPPNPFLAAAFRSESAFLPARQ